jgi:hypothetical protein
MSPDLDAKLCTDFSLLYSVRYADTRDTLSHVGFETGGSWFDIIYEVSAKLESLIKKLSPEERNNYYAAQVKEKFGILNFYMSKATEEMRSSIGEAEGKSASTCEECGHLGRLRGGRWRGTLCDAHATKGNKIHT